MIANEEDLGRRVYSEGKAKRAERGRIDPDIFRERLGIPTLSVDRLSCAEMQFFACIADDGAASRGKDRVFGWAAVNAGLAGSNGRSVIATPLASNVHHADIELPKDCLEDKDRCRIHAIELAVSAKWVRRPE